MQFIPEIAQGLSFVVFAWYGMACFLSTRMVAEFERYQLGRYRVLTGLLQVGAGIGLLLGHFYRPILIASAAGLSLMMLLAVVTRFRIRDPWYYALPAFFLCVLNAYIAFAAL